MSPKRSTLQAEVYFIGGPVHGEKMTVSDLRSIFKVLGVNYHRMTLRCGGRMLRAYAAEGLPEIQARYDLCEILGEPFSLHPYETEAPGQAAARVLSSTARKISKEAPGEEAAARLKVQAARVLLGPGGEA